MSIRGINVSAELIQIELPEIKKFVTELSGTGYIWFTIYSAKYIIYVHI